MTTTTMKNEKFVETDEQKIERLKKEYFDLYKYENIGKTPKSITKKLDRLEQEIKDLQNKL